MDELKILGYEYDVVTEATSLLTGNYPDDTYEVDGWNINLIHYELWSNGDRVKGDARTITATTQENELNWIVDIAKTTAITMLMFEQNIMQHVAHKKFKKHIFTNGEWV